MLKITQRSEIWLHILTLFGPKQAGPNKEEKTYWKIIIVLLNSRKEFRSSNFNTINFLSLEGTSHLTLGPFFVVLWEIIFKTFVVRE